MKVSPKEIDKYLQNPLQCTSALVYGSDEGLVRSRIKTILSALIKDPNDNFSLIQIEEHQIKETPSIIIDSLSSLSLLGDTPVIYYRDASDKYVSLITEALKKSSCTNFLLVGAGELSTKSSLRRYYDTQKNVASIACYQDDIRSLVSYIGDFLKKNNISYDQQTLIYLSNFFGKNRAITDNELQKLITYLGDDKKITIKLIEEITQKNDEKTIDDLCIALCDVNLSLTNILCERLIQEGNEPIAIIRSLSRYFSRILTTHAHMQNGLSLDNALNKLQPPVFWKYIDSFKRHTHELNNEKLFYIISRLQETEREMKHGHDNYVIVLRTITAICLHIKRK